MRQQVLEVRSLMGVGLKMRKRINEQLLTDTNQRKEEIDQSARLERDWGAARG